MLFPELVDPSASGGTPINVLLSKWSSRGICDHTDKWKFTFDLSLILHSNYQCIYRGCWFEIDPSAAAQCRMPISVYMHDENSGGLIAIAEYGQEYGKEDPIRVLYHGFGHYDALQIPGTKGSKSRL